MWKMWKTLTLLTNNQFYALPLFYILKYSYVRSIHSRTGTLKSSRAGAYAIPPTPFDRKGGFLSALSDFY